MRRKTCLVLAAALLLHIATAQAASAVAPLDSLLKELGVDNREVAISSTPADDVIVKKLEASPTGKRYGLTLAWIEVKRARPRVDVRPVKQYGMSHEVIEKATPTAAIAVINGGFFGYDAKGAYMPLGLLITDGQQMNRKTGWTGGGIFYQDKELGLHVVSPSTPIDMRTVKTAIQSKPVLVEDGRQAIRSDDGERFNRTAILLTTSGEVILAGAFQSFGRAMTMKEFARFVGALKSSSGASVKVALGMDGGPGAQLYVPALKLHFGDPGKNFVPNLVFLTN